MLLDLATADEFPARSLLPIEGITDGGLGFHTQQAVEKALKAVLAVNGVEFPYSHDLNGLIGLCRRSGVDIPEGPWPMRVICRCSPSGCATTRVRRPTSTETKPSHGQPRPSRGRGLSWRLLSARALLDPHSCLKALARRAADRLDRAGAQARAEELWP